MEHEDEEVYGWIRRFQAQIMDYPKSILDIGCRSGYGTRRLKEIWPKADIQGIDINHLCLNKAPKYCLQMDACQLNYDGDAFEWIFSCATLEHVWNVDQAAQEWMRVASKGIYVVTNLEKEPSASHYSWTLNPFDWLNSFDYPGWRLNHCATLENDKVFEFSFKRDPYA